ncbi:homoprotocatechuate degradation operon regulator HpaR [Salinihabitans flavidus]|nr:homoprotocatechuate degradation operon regulator HpaR [Salinihabitans flavidus]
MNAGPKTPSTARSLPIALLRARERVMGPIRVMLSDAGVTEQQWRVLRVLDENGPMDPTSIADQAVLLLPSLTRILQKLESKGLVTRIQSETDRRRQVVSVTPEGSALISANLEASIQIFDQLRMQMGEDRYDALLDLLSELNDLDI